MSKKLFCLLSFILLFGMVGDGRSADEIYFTELFEDTNFSQRGWYDNTSLILSTSEHIPGSTSSAEFLFEVDATTPTSGGAIRKLFTATESVYFSFYIKHSTNWTGSNQSYHPHQFQFLTNLDGAWTGPAYTYTTIYIETNEGEPLLALQDSQNIDEQNIGIDLTDITEERGIAGCNGNSDGTGVDDCYQSGSDYRNGKKWEAGSVYFQDSQGDYYKADWHFIEAYFQLNTIDEGEGVADGVAQYWYDGELIIDYNNLILRTGENPTMKYNQFLIAPWIGDGSPVEQTFWIDNVTVANYRVGSALGKATDPSPADSAENVSIDADLGWTAGANATSHEVYFGTTSPGTYKGNQTATTYEPGTLDYNTPYYWRIDEVNAEGTETGDVWSFTTESLALNLPWSDDFESGDLVTGGWTTSGSASASSKAEYTGIYGAQLKGSAWMEKAISTAGFTSIHVKYARKTGGLDSGEYLYAEYHDGTQWNELEATQASSWASQDKTCGASANNNANFKVRFRLNANRANEYAYIDDVEITGTAQ